MKKKMMALVLCVALVAVAAVGATMAYFTDTREVTNTFTVGKVEIALDEAKVTKDGVPVEGANRVLGNEYKLFPGSTYTKDPTVTVGATSEDAYVRMLVEVQGLDELKDAFPADRYPECYAADGTTFLLQELVEGWDSTYWASTNVCTVETKAIEGKNVVCGTYEFRHNDIVKASEKMDALFDSFTIPEKATAADIAHLENVKIKVIAHAIQAEGLTAANAWDKF